MTDIDKTKIAKLALVTGASRGIGKVIMNELAKNDITVIGTATTDKGAESITDSLKKSGYAGKGFVLNVSDVESIDSCMSQIVKEFGDISILVNNAGVTRDNLLMRMKDDEWHDVIHTNLDSVYRLSKSVLRGMMKQRFGRIINITSIVALMGNAGQTNYSATKAGIIGFSRSLAREVASRGITVNAIAPGFIKTDMTDALSEEQKTVLTQSIPAARLGSPEDIASAVLFLASESASYITGETININGGMYMN